MVLYNIHMLYACNGYVYAGNASVTSRLGCVQIPAPTVFHTPHTTIYSPRYYGIMNLCYSLLMCMEYMPMPP